MDIIIAEPGQLTPIKTAVFPHETGDYTLEKSAGRGWDIAFFPIDESPAERSHFDDIPSAMALLVSRGASEFGLGA